MTSAGGDGTAHAYWDAVGDPWARVALPLQITCGLRIGEVLAFRAKD